MIDRLHMINTLTVGLILVYVGGISAPAAAGSECNAKLIELKTLYRELKTFKDNPVFHVHGFRGPHRPFDHWFDRVLRLKKNREDRCFVKAQGIGYYVGPQDLTELAFEYIRLKGRARGRSQGLVQYFEKVLTLPLFRE